MIHSIGFFGYLRKPNPQIPPLKIGLRDSICLRFNSQLKYCHNQWICSLIQPKQQYIRKPSGGSSQEITTEILLKRAIDSGLTAADLDMMSIGMVLDYLVTCYNENQEKESPKRYATAADIEAF